MYARMHVMPESKREHVEERARNSYVVSVKEPAERNLANKSAVRLLAKHLKIPAAKVRIISGHHRPGKIVSIDI